MDPIDYCRGKAAPPGSSLHYALLFAEPQTRSALLALHAFRAEVTEIVDECSDPGVATVKLDWWQEEVGRLFDGRARHPVGQALQPAVAEHALPREPFVELLEGAGMDLEYGGYPSFRELSHYCHRVGCSIAQLAATVCGYQDPETTRYAHDLGMALQLTRLLRDVRRHADAGRVYIPEDEMRRAGVERSDLLQPEVGERLRGLFSEQGERAVQFFDQALARLPAVDRRRQRPGLILAALYRALLREMARDGYPLLARRHHLTPLRKLWIAWLTDRRLRRQAVSPACP